MFRFIETIRLEQGEFKNLEYHQARINKTITHFGSMASMNLEKILTQSHPPLRGLIKCRVVYQIDETTEGEELEVQKIEFLEYTLPSVKSLKTIEVGALDYSFKYENREMLQQIFAMRGPCDDVLMIKNGIVTDCTYSNIIFRLKSNWITPRLCMLEGTMRSKLLNTGQIKEADIHVNDLKSFETFKLINAMVGVELPEQPIDQIFN